MEDKLEKLTCIKKPYYSAVDAELIFKLILIGDSGVGKSSLSVRFVEDRWGEHQISGLGINFSVRSVEVDGTCIKLRIHDTAGQERFRTLTPSYYRGALGVFLVFDITNLKSFQNVKSWVNALDEYGGDHVVKLLLGNKCDLEDKRVVSYEEAKNYADQLGIAYIETSAKMATNVDKAFMVMTADIKKLVDTGVLNSCKTPTALNKEAHVDTNEYWIYGCSKC